MVVFKRVKVVEIAILCGGRGKRMGNVNKGLLKICERTFIEVIYEELKNLGKVYIIGRKRDFTHFKIPAYDDIFPDFGPLGGIYTAFNIARSSYVLLVPCDMPTFKKEHAIYLEEVLVENYADISIFYTDRITPIPGIYKTSLKDTVRKRLKDKNLSMANFIRSQNVVVAIVKDLGYFKNVNTKEDYEDLLRNFPCEKFKKPSLYLEK